TRSLDEYAPGDGDAWRRLYALWTEVGDGLVRSLLSPFPPVLPAAGLVWRLGPTGVLRLARRVTLPARRFGEEEFAGAGGALLIAGNTLHTDLSPEGATGALIGWLLCSLAQQHGFPVPEGGAGQLAAALVRRLESRGGRVECGNRVVRIVVEGRRAIGVTTGDGSDVRVRRAVLAEVDAPQLFLDLVGPDHLSGDFLADLRRFHFDHATVKVDWALDAPIPWKLEGPGDAGTVHLADSMDELTHYSAELAPGQLPRQPFPSSGR
ncbi:MAG TPA: FAD-dependent oxidoreductase, partial [Acidimicrobiales bacterium]|nr:FAD-dependent oxidoreductase [Acidimicrobiales bacterium]